MVMRVAVRKAIVVGSINRDIVAYVEQHPRPGETVLTPRGQLFPGGKGANQAVAIARMGGKVEFIGRVGADVFGAEMRAFLANERVDVAGIVSVEGAMTGLGLITVDAQGQNAIAVVSGANGVWEQTLAPIGALAGDVVVCQLEVPLRVVAEAFRQARDCGARTVLNAAPFRPIDAEILGVTDILIVNQLELAALVGGVTVSGCDERSALRARAGSLLGRGPELVVVTLGAGGVELLGRDIAALAIAGRGMDVRDTTGAGDCFVGAFVAELLRGETVQDAAVFANAAAAISVTREGAAASLPMRDEVLRILGRLDERQS